MCSLKVSNRPHTTQFFYGDLKAGSSMKMECIIHVMFLNDSRATYHLQLKIL